MTHDPESREESIPIRPLTVETSIQARIEDDPELIRSEIANAILESLGEVSGISIEEAECHVEFT